MREESEYRRTSNPTVFLRGGELFVQNEDESFSPFPYEVASTKENEYTESRMNWQIKTLYSTEGYTIFKESPTGPFQCYGPRQGDEHNFGFATAPTLEEAIALCEEKYALSNPPPDMNKWEEAQ